MCGMKRTMLWKGGCAGCGTNDDYISSRTAFVSGALVLVLGGMFGVIHTAHGQSLGLKATMQRATLLNSFALKTPRQKYNQTIYYIVILWWLFGRKATKSHRAEQ